MLYGATGYTGGLIAQECARRGLRPVLAGRDASRLQALSATLGLPHHALSLEDRQPLIAALREVRLVLHCAGPFSQTSADMRHACIAAGTHYLDITGEIDVFVTAHDDDARAREAGVLLCPGVGFDVVPTDCVAATLKQAMPDASELTLGFSGVDALSPGTTVTFMEAVYRGASRVRDGGRIVDVPFGERSRIADFGRGPEPSLVIPWGDVATAYYTTGIPDIEVHIPLHSPSGRAIRALLPMRRLMASSRARRFAHPLLRAVAAGPTENQRAGEKARIWGEVRNPSGRMRRATVQTMNGYSLTVQTALMAVQQVLRNPVPGGYCTPSQLLGADCLESLDSHIAMED